MPNDTTTRTLFLSHTHTKVSFVSFSSFCNQSTLSTVCHRAIDRRRRRGIKCVAVAYSY